ncbi:MAG: hypothetical protein ACLGH3_04080 [Actinomycetota bacterium]
MDEKDLRARLHGAVDGTDPDSDQLWEDIMSGSEHARRVRNARRTALGFSVVALAIAIPVAINLAGTERDPNFAGPGDDIPRSPIVEGTRIEGVTPLYQAEATYMNTRLNIAVDLPPGFRAGEFEGNVSIYPEGLPGPVEGGDTAWLEIFYGDEELAFGTDRGENDPPITQETIGGVPARSQERELANGGRHKVWFVERWVRDASQRGAECCPDANPSMIVFIETSDQALTNEYYQTLWAMVRSITTADGAADQLPIRTRRGSVATDLSVLQGDVQSVATFLDDRLWNEQPKRLLTSEAVAAYEGMELPSGDDWLTPTQYGYYESYEVTASRAADANSVEFDVVLRYRDQRDRVTIISETLFVGPGRTSGGQQLDWVIRGVDGRLGETSGGPATQGSKAGGP